MVTWSACELYYPTFISVLNLKESQRQVKRQQQSYIHILSDEYWDTCNKINVSTDWMSYKIR